LPAELRNECPEVNWRGLARLRDLIAHGYFKANLEIIWHDIHTHLPSIVSAVNALLEQRRDDAPDAELKP